jgi:hypothetical protein
MTILPLTIANHGVPETVLCSRGTVGRVVRAPSVRGDAPVRDVIRQGVKPFSAAM